MELTMLIARLLGVMYLVVGVAVLSNMLYYYKLFKEIEKQKLLMFFMSILTLVLGVLVLTYHNTWGNGVEALVTVIGWMMVIKGVINIMFPEWVMNVVKAVLVGEGIRVMGIVAFFLGVLLSFYGFLL